MWDGPAGGSDDVIFFGLTSLELGLLFFGVLLGSTAVGVILGRRVRHLSDSLKEPFGILQGALLGVVGLLLAFGLSLAVSRYEDRRADVVDEANAIGTTYLRAQTLPEPVRSRLARSARPLHRERRPARGRRAAERRGTRDERPLRRAAAAALGARRHGARRAAARQRAAPVRRDAERDDRRAAVRLAGLTNRVPTAVLLLDCSAPRVALGLLAAYLAIVGRGVVAVTLGAVLVAFLLLVTADLDRPTRGMIQVPDTALYGELASMRAPPAAPAP